MILIAESGSTKTDWALIIDKVKVFEFQTVGINPNHFKNWKALKKELFSILSDFNTKIKKVYFYGSGCGTKSSELTLINELKDVFPNASFTINNDLIAACISTSYNSNQIVCIIGTGSNSCLFKNNIIEENISAPGYLFGDEGGGVDLGKRLLTGVLRSELSEELIKKFYSRFDLNYQKMIENCYSNDTPNQYIASFSVFLKENEENDYLKEIIKDSFRSLFKNQIRKYSNYESYSLSFVGSIAFYYEVYLREVAKEFNLNIKTIIKAPIKNLVEYHLKEK